MGALDRITMAGPAPSRYADSLGLADASLTMSPAHSRLCELTHRMTAVHDDFEAEKKARSSVMELKCRAIDEKIMRKQRSDLEKKITKQIDQACINLREDFAREKE